jgi:hypothetical protein
MNTVRRFRTVIVLLIACLGLGAGPAVATADPPTTHDLEVLKAQLDGLVAQGKAGGVQFWYVDRATLTVRLTVLRTALLDPITTAFLAVAKVRPELVSIELVDTPTTTLIGYGRSAAGSDPRANTLYGGQKITAANGGYCTSGFNALDANNNPAVLTAGHCTKAGLPNWTASGAALGNINDYNYPNADWSAITPTSGWSLPSAVQTASGVQPITAWSTPRLNEAICKTGATSATTCGTVTALNVTVNYGDGPVYGLTRTSVYAAEGDSGGSVYDGGTGVALISGGPKGGGPAFVQPLNF